MAAQVTPKIYECTQCGTQKVQNTNHYGKTHSVGRYNVCPSCPPFKKYAEFGGQTVWVCLEQPKGEEVSNG